MRDECLKLPRVIDATRGWALQSVAALIRAGRTLVAQSFGNRKKFRWAPGAGVAARESGRLSRQIRGQMPPEAT